MNAPRFLNYDEAVTYLYHQLPMYSKIGSAALRPGLDNIIALCAYLGNPQKELKSIHIAGSNGKGSVSHLLSGTFQSAGYKTGLYTSPHLVDLRERFRINGALIHKEWIVDFLNKHINFITQLSPSYFELNVAMAFKVFAEEGVDIAIIETGLGGRLDSTNIILPELSVITNISLEHTQILGNTLQEIAGEKAGIIKSNVPVVIGETQDTTDSVFFAKAVQEQAPITFADSLWHIAKINADAISQTFKLIKGDGSHIIDITTDLMGVYQKNNLVTAVASIERMQLLGWKVNIHHLQDAAKQIKKLTGLQGRWDILQFKPNIIIDVAHNPSGMSFLIDNLKQLEIKGTLYIILGCANDKDVKALLTLIPEHAQLILTQASVQRAMEIETLSNLTATLGRTYNAFKNVSDAIDNTLQHLQDEDTLLVTGSFFVVADALNYLNEQRIIL